MKKGILKALSGSMVTTICSFGCAMIAHADDGADVVSDLTSGGTDGGIFSPAVKAITTIGKDGYGLIKVFALVVGLIVVSIAAIQIGAAKQGNKRDEGKERFMYILLGIGIVFAAGAIISMAVTAGSGI